MGSAFVTQRSLAGHQVTVAARDIAKAVAGVDVVKAFNTIFAQVLAKGGDFGDGRRVTLFIAGDSEQGKNKVHTVAESMGFSTMDAGGLRNARYLEPPAGLNLYLG